MTWTVTVGTNDYGTARAEDVYDVVERRDGGESQVADCGAIRREGTRERAYLIAAAPLGPRLAKAVLADPLSSATSRRLAARLLKKATPPPEDK